jgi:hypothetical protein
MPPSAPTTPDRRLLRESLVRLGEHEQAPFEAQLEQHVFVGWR